MAAPDFAHADLEATRARWAAAQSAWNRQGGDDLVVHIRRGEDLYFAAADLIEALSERLAAASAKL